jgi:hypothetical protein
MFVTTNNKLIIIYFKILKFFIRFIVFMNVVNLLYRQSALICEYQSEFSCYNNLIT